MFSLRNNSTEIMTSNNHSNNMIPANVKIKIEPGTSRLSDTVNNIKLEPGTSGRLSSLKLPRDLKLGGTAKAKLFKPNLNVTRKKQTNVNLPSPNTRGRGRGGRGRGSDRGGGRGAFRGRQSNLVQSQGVFSEGIADTMIKRPYETRENSVYDVTKVMDRPTINKNIEWKVDKEQEDLIMKDILSIQIEPDDPDAKNDLHPIFLPVNKISSDKPTKYETLIKSEEMPLENGINEETSTLLESNEKLLLFQFPDTLPGIGAVTEPEKETASSHNSGNNDTEKSQTENKCTLQDVNEGLLGKIVIYKSGKKKLIIGNNRFDVEMGPNAGFLQDVMSVPVNTTSKSGDMINLGSLDGNVIITPEWNSLLYSE